MDQLWKEFNELPVRQKFKKLLEKSVTTREIIFIIALIFCLTPIVSPLLLCLLALRLRNSLAIHFLHLNHKATSFLLKVSVVGLGFGMNVQSAVHAGKEGIFLPLLPLQEH